MSLEIVNKLKPITFRYNDILKTKTDDKIHMGFLAQELLEVFGDDYAIIIKNKETNYLMVQYTELIAPMVKAIQELSEKVDILEKQLNSQERIK